MKLCLVCNFQFGDEQELCPKDYSKLVPLGKDPLIGKIIQDRYKIDSIIAKGSMGVVYKAVQELIGREVAVKVLHGYLVSDDESSKRFLKEAKAASRLNHPNITTLYDYGVLPTGQPYIVMDLLRGETLADLLKQRDCLPLDKTLIVFKQVCDALAEAHKCGVIHRDMKPENIVVERTEKGVFVKVVDFGIAKFVQEAEDTIGKITKTGTVCGSPTYMSPEQCDDNVVDHRSDIYSLGIVLYETITGRVPFDAADVYNVMAMHVKDPPPRLKVMRPDLEFPPYIEQVIDKALAKDPDARFQSVSEFWEALSNPHAMQRRSTQNFDKATANPHRPPVVLDEKEVSGVVQQALDRKMRNTGNSSTEQVPVVDPELVRKKVQAATLILQDRDGQARKPQSYPAVSIFERMGGLFQQAWPALLTLAISGALLWVVSHEALVHSFIDHTMRPIFVHKTTSKSHEDVGDMIAAGKLDQARLLLEKRKKEGKLSTTDADNLNWVYQRLAKNEAKAKHYDKAVIYLEQISADSQDEEIQALLKKYKRLAGKGGKK